VPRLGGLHPLYDLATGGAASIQPQREPRYLREIVPANPHPSLCCPFDELSATEGTFAVSAYSGTHIEIDCLAHFCVGWIVPGWNSGEAQEVESKCVADMVNIV